MKTVAIYTLLSLCTISRVHGQMLEIYVSPQGSDTNDGTKYRPFKTLEAARNALRQTDVQGASTLWLRAGRYDRSCPFELRPEDSGRQGWPVTYRAWPGEEVRISGGQEVSDWQPVTDAAVLNKLSAHARSNIIQADMKALKVYDYGEAGGGGIELFFQDKPMVMSRWPNEGFVSVGDLMEPNTINVRGRSGSSTGQFMYTGDRPENWFDETDIWVHGYWFNDWADQYHKVDSIDTLNRIVSLEPPYHVYGYRTNQWFYWLNILAELDMPGEWYLDRDRGILYFWPPEPIQQGRAVVSVLGRLVDMDEVCHIKFQGIIFESSRATPLVLKDCRHVEVVGCEIRNLGGRGIIIEGGEANVVVSCNIHGTARGGIEMRGGDRPSLTPAGHAADNNHIYHTGRWYRTYTPAILLDGVGNRASHNKIHDVPHIAIRFRGNDHSIAYNEIHDVCLETNDAGAIYAGRDWTMRGTTIQHNYLHDIVGYLDRGCVGVYLDDMFCDTHIYGNIFYRVTRAVFIGGGRDCLVENNMFVDCDPSLHIDARGIGWASKSVAGSMMDRLRAMPYTSPLWAERYPELRTILEDEPGTPRGNTVCRNVSYGGYWDEVQEGARPYVDLRNNWVDKDPLFEGTPPESYALQEHSPVHALAFEPIYLADIGLYRDAYRRDLPEP